MFNLAMLQHISTNTWLEAGAACAVVLIAAGWQARSIMRKRRARRRRMAVVVSDAIMLGSNSPRMEGQRHTARRMEPVIGELEKLNGKDGQWGFSLRDADKAILTFAYPSREKADAALKAMRRACKDLTFAFEPDPSQAGSGEMPWEMDGADPAHAGAGGRGPRAFAAPHPWN